MPTATLARYPSLYDMSLLAIAVLDLKTFTVVYSNASFLRQQKGHALVSGMELFREPLLREAANQCWQQQSMVWTALPGSLLRIELAPLAEENSQEHYLQCLLLPAQPPSSAGLAHEQHRQAAAPSGISPAYARIIDHLPHNTWLCTAQGEVFWTNRTSNRFTYGTDEMHDASNTRYINKVHPDDLTGAGIALSRAMQGNPPERPYRYRLRDHQGIFRWHEFSVAPVHDDDDQVIYWVGSSVNIEHTVAEHAALQAQLQRAHEELEQQRQYTAIEQKMALVNHLAGGIAHDLNNLLQVVVACTEMALLARPAPAVESKLRLIADCTNRAGRMSSQLASFSGRLPQNARVLDTVATLQECAQLLQRAVGAEIAFETRIAGDLHPVLADRSQLENALINLAINARDAVAGRGQVVFEACNTTAADADGKPQAYVRLSLTDDGIGMDAALQQHVFEPFFTTKPDGAGTGLGLSMVRRFIDASKGRISLQSEPGKGTRISLLLPRSVQQAAPDQSHHHCLPSLKLKVLLVEDDEQVRQAILLLLARLDCDAIPSFNIDHALALLNGGLRPDAIISDIRMPGHNTIRELIAWVRENGDIPLLFATGYSPDVAVAEGLVEGKYPVLFKPFPLEELAVALQRQRPGASA
ncbi:MAG: ATP-binding protein [Stenotrophomonas sp.]